MLNGGTWDNLVSNHSNQRIIAIYYGLSLVTVRDTLRM